MGKVFLYTEKATGEIIKGNKINSFCYRKNKYFCPSKSIIKLEVKLKDKNICHKYVLILPSDKNINQQKAHQKNKEKT